MRRPTLAPSQNGAVRRLGHHPVVAAGSGWDTPYLDWAQRAGLTEPGPHGTEGLPLDLWERMLARAARLHLLDMPRGPAALHEVLVGHGLRPKGVTPERGARAGWPELARDVARLARQGTRLPRGPLQVEPHRAACLARLACRSPAHAGAALRKRREPPTLADACLLLADAAGPARPPARGKPHAPAARPAPTP